MAACVTRCIFYSLILIGFCWLSTWVGRTDTEEREGEREGEREFALVVLRLAGVLVVGTDAVNQEMGMR